jgi:protein-S-isoprenylcysteine O-methyltransferase Ste14
MPEELDTRLDDPSHGGSELQRRGIIALDVLERSIIVLLYAFLVERIAATYSSTHEVVSLLVVPSEGLVVLFALIRRRTQTISRSPWVWLLALAATCAPMSVNASGSSPIVPPIAGALLLVFGMIVQVHAKLTLGRSFGCVPAHRGLRIAGPYKFVRHPMYAGYLLGHVAFLLIYPTLWNLSVYAATYALQIPRLLIEERLLGADPAYREYQSVVRYRLLPGLF